MFNTLVQKAGLDEQTNATVLITLYMQSLKKDLAEAIILQGTPDTFRAVMDKALVLDSYKRRAEQFVQSSPHNKSSGNHGNKSGWDKEKKPHVYPQKDYQGELMEIDQIAP